MGSSVAQATTYASASPSFVLSIEAAQFRYGDRRKEREVGMANDSYAELVWIRRKGRVETVVLFRGSHATAKRSARQQSSIVVSNLTLPLVTQLPKGKLVYRTPIRTWLDNGKLKAGPVFGILAGTTHFTGARANFRDLQQMGRDSQAFVYVIPTEHISTTGVWQGKVRVAHQKWISIPCPRPEAIYNRIPNRALERNQHAIHAKQEIARSRIPMFNPDYFNKAKIYDVLRRHRLESYLPETRPTLNRQALFQMLLRHRGVYLKPAGGSVGHGILRLRQDGGEWDVQVLKNGRSEGSRARSLTEVWELTQRLRLPGRYVMQEEIERIEWQGRPCDLRVLAQKADGQWHIVGTGVRVAGQHGITTHVPHGGSIVAFDKVLDTAFDSATAKTVQSDLERMIVLCAHAIDAEYDGEVGEMSMDIGVDKRGQLWFFEANAKPMKFDEQDIRKRSLQGIIAYLEELRNHPRIR